MTIGMMTKRIREERSVNMGKHDKVEPVTTFSWQPMPDEWYKARIETLEKENLRLAEENKRLEMHVEYMSRRLEVTEDNAITEVVSLEKMLLNAAKQVWGE